MPPLNNLFCDYDTLKNIEAVKDTKFFWRLSAVIVTLEIMKKINAGIASQNFLTFEDILTGCSLDRGTLETVVEDLSKQVTSMSIFFDTMESYVAELDNRLKMMAECYKAIQKLQIDNQIISPTDEIPDPAIVWRS